MRWTTWALAGALGGTTALLGCTSQPMSTADSGPGMPDARAGDAGTMEDAGSMPDAGADAGPTDSGAPIDAPMERMPPELTAAERAVIATLSPLPDVPPDTTNAVADDPRAAALGHALFFDARYSGPLAVTSDLGMMGEAGRVSCASCHSSEVMSDDRSMPDNVSLGANFHTRNAPAIVNSAFYRWTNWGGRFSAQWELPPVVAESPVIMNSSRLQIAHHIFDNYREEYEAIFGAMDPALSDLARFPATGRPVAMGMPAGPWEMMSATDRDIVLEIFTNYGKAIQAYQRQLISRDAPFDRFVAGDEDAIGVSAQWGLRLFIGMARCVTCHSGPQFSDDEFHNLWIPQTGEHVPMTDTGRYSSIPALLSSSLNSAGLWSDDPAAGMARLAGLTMTPPEATRGAFRTPTLRGVAASAPYMHSGQLATLEGVIELYDQGGGATPIVGERSSHLFPLHLTAQDREDLLAFLLALTGEPVPEALRSAPTD